MTDSAAGGTPRNAALLAGWASILSVVALCTLANVAVMVGLVTSREAADPWEAAITVAGDSWARGHSPYEESRNGNATHMYGPLLERLLGAVFTLTGTDVRVGRAVSGLSAMIVIALLLWLCVKQPRIRILALYAALLIAVNNYSAGYFTIGKPDMPAMLLALLGCCFHYRALQTSSFAFLVAASACACASLFFKQNLAGLVLAVPAGYALSCLARLDAPTLHKAMWSLVPTMAVLVTIAILREFFPVIFSYMFELPASYRIQWSRIPYWAEYGLKAQPLLLFLLGAAACAAARNSLSRLDCHVFSAALAALGISVLSAAKFGGDRNSMLLFLTCFAGASIYYSEKLGVIPRLEAVASRSIVGSLAGSAFAAGVLAVGAFPSDIIRMWGIRHQERSGAFSEVVAKVKQLGSMSITSPEDPTITLAAGIEPGLNLYVELDHQGLAGGEYAPNAALKARLASYTYLVEVTSPIWGTFEMLTPELISELGFSKAWQNSRYALWVRTPNPPTR